MAVFEGKKNVIELVVAEVGLDLTHTRKELGCPGSFRI